MTLPESMLDDINAKMHEGSCPSAGSLGECCIISEIRPGVFESVLYIWDDAFNDSAAVAGWFKEAGADSVTLSQTLYCDDNGNRNGLTPEGTREWTVIFTLADQVKAGEK